MVAPMLAQLCEQVLTRADKGTSNQEVQAYYDIHRQLNTHAQPVEVAFVQALAEALERFERRELDTEIGVDRYRGDLLALVEYDDLEESIAISTITRTLEERFEAPLWLLSHRLAALIGGDAKGLHSHPVAPAQFCKALRSALAPMDLSTPTVLMAYKALDQQLHLHLGALYDGLNAYLLEAGILPALSYNPSSVTGSRPQEATGSASTSENSTSQSLPRWQELSTPVAAPDPTQPSAQYQLQLLKAIGQLQNQLASAAVTTAGEAKVDTHQNLPTCSMQYIDTATWQLQSKTLQNTVLLVDDAPGLVPPQDITSASQHFRAQLTTQTPTGVLNGRNQQTLDLVAMIFETILDDEKVPAAVKALLSYLYTPFLKLALMEADFLERQTNHPARVLLNNLADAGALWCGELALPASEGSDHGERKPRRNPAYKKIKEVVSKILEDFNGDVKLFIEQNHLFQVFVEKYKRRQQLLEKRLVEKVKGREKLQQATQRVKQEMALRFDDKPYSTVSEPLRTPWSDYLIHTYLRHGDGSTHWVSAIAALDTVVDSITPPVSAGGLPRLREVQAQALDVQAACFEKINYDQLQTEQCLKRLQRLQREAIQIKPGSPVKEPPKPREPGEQDPHPPGSHLSDDERQLVEALTHIEFGAMMESAEGRRIKVAWYDSETRNYLLVDQMGKEVGFKTGLELAQWMLKNSATLIENSTKPLFERALEKIFQNLNAKALACTP